MKEPFTLRTRHATYYAYELIEPRTGRTSDIIAVVSVDKDERMQTVDYIYGATLMDEDEITKYFEDAVRVAERFADALDLEADLHDFAARFFPWWELPEDFDKVDKESRERRANALLSDSSSELDGLIQWMREQAETEEDDDLVEEEQSLLRRLRHLQKKGARHA